jgi:uncharacterized protein (DUF1800 family)
MPSFSARCLTLESKLWVAGRAAVAATLCVLLFEQPVLAEAALSKHPAAKKQAAPAQIAGQQRVLHALNRFTFGPRPGDVAAVEKMGLDKWFEAQLNPQSIDDSSLDARLAEYPAMQLSIDQLSARYPGPQMIRAYEAGRIALPSDPTQRAMVNDQIAFYKIQKAKQAAAGDAAKATAGDSALAAMNDAATPAMTKKGTPKAAVSSVDADPLLAPDAAQSPSSMTHEKALAILALAPDQRVATILALPPADLVRFRQSLRPLEMVQMARDLSPEQKELLTALPGAGRMVALETTESRMLRDLLSERQLEAVMTDFWLNHFNVYLRKSQQEPYLIPTYERETIRPNALGNFETLLVAVAKSPAMQVYLDNFKSVGPDSKAATRVKRLQQLRPNGKIVNSISAGLNENYGRELMELHTVGVNGAGYTQADVTNVAKVFTGWGVSRPAQPGSGDGGQFEFNENRHEPGAKVVLGVTIPEGGQQEGMQVLHMLATSPATAHFISQKLAVRFVSDTPPPALVDRMAASFTASHGDIKTVLRTMFHSPEFWSPEVYRAKVKTPEEFLLSAVRASGAEVVNPAPLVQALDRLGQPFYGMQTPNGYSWTQEGWVGTGQLVNRMNFALVLSGDRIPGTRTAWSRLLDAPTAPAQVVPAAYTGTETAAQKELLLENLLLGQPVSDRTRSTVLGESNDATVTAQAETQFDLRAQAGDKNAVRTKGLLRGNNGANFRPATDDPQAAVMAGLLLGSPEFQRR